MGNDLTTDAVVSQGQMVELFESVRQATDVLNQFLIALNQAFAGFIAQVSPMFEEMAHILRERYIAQQRGQLSERLNRYVPTRLAMWLSEHCPEKWLPPLVME